VTTTELELALREAIAEERQASDLYQQAITKKCRAQVALATATLNWTHEAQWADAFLRHDMAECNRITEEQYGKRVA
jgi:hypothetical protein